MSNYGHIFCTTSFTKEGICDISVFWNHIFAAISFNHLSSVKTQTTSSSRMHLHVIKMSSSANIFSNCQSYKKKMFKGQPNWQHLLFFQTLCDHIDIFDVMTSAHCFSPSQGETVALERGECVHVYVVLQRDICLSIECFEAGRLFWVSGLTGHELLRYYCFH